MKWLIIEDALKDKRGHYFEYISTFKRGLDSCGDDVAIFTDRTADSWITEALGSSPMLPRCIWRRMNDGAPRWKKLLRYPAHGWQTFRAWASIFRRGQQPEVVFVPSVFTHHLCGIVPFLLLFGWRKPCTFLLFFPSTPIQFDIDTQSPILKPDLTARLFPWLLRRLRRLVSSGKVILAVETRAMGDALARITGLPFTYLPHPVSATGNTEYARAKNPDQSGSPITFGSYGFARFEKGSDVLQEAVKIVLEDPAYAHCRFVLQWIEDFADGSGMLVGKDAELLKNPNVQFIDDFFDPAGGYVRQLAKTDVMVLPYRDSYRYRLSRVVIEAMMAGIPVVVSPETTLAEQSRDHGAAIETKDLTPVALAEAIKRAADQIAGLKEEAQRKAVTASGHFSVSRFRQLLANQMAMAAD